MQTIRAAVEQRIARANELIIVVDDQGAAAETEVKTSMAALCRVIDEHERSTLQQITTKRTQEKKELDDYKGALEGYLQYCDLQKAKLAKLTTDGTKTDASKIRLRGLYGEKQ